MSTQDHPVWDVYDFRGSAQIIQMYYGRRLYTIERRLANQNVQLFAYP